MAAETTFLGGYKVGLISASLSAKSEKEGKKKKRDSSFLFDSGEVAQPTFIPVKKKVNITKYCKYSMLPSFRTMNVTLYLLIYITGIYSFI